MNEICGECKYHRYDRESGDWVCENDDSEYFAEFTDYNDSCDGYEER